MTWRREKYTGYGTLSEKRFHSLLCANKDRLGIKSIEKQKDYGQYKLDFYIILNNGKGFGIEIDGVSHNMAEEINPYASRNLYFESRGIQIIHIDSQHVSKYSNEIVHLLEMETKSEYIRPRPNRWKHLHSCRTLEYKKGKNGSWKKK